MSIVLGASLAFSTVYGLAYCYRQTSLARFLIKTAATALLALWAYLAGGPVLLVAALALSTIGDAFLGAGEERYLLPGMAAFFAAHVAYIILFWGLATDTRTWMIIAAQIGLVIGAATFLRSLVPWIDKSMRGPVIGYGIIIAVMGSAALRLEPQLWLAMAGAAAFIVSDTILSFELFRMKPDDPVRKMTSRLVWVLYYGGQAAIAYAFVRMLI